jgi:N-acetylmuramoyl-L-alanine amidase CwlA
MLTIQKKLTPYNYTALSGKKNEFIVVHYVGAVSTAKNNVDYYASQLLQASATYFVDQTSIWQSVEDYNRAWHCGGGLQGNGGHSFYQICANSNSIGIEMCVKKDANGVWYFEEETVTNTVDLIRYLMNKYGIPIDKVIRHYDVTGKICPEPYVRNNGAEWDKLKQRILGAPGYEIVDIDIVGVVNASVLNIRNAPTTAAGKIGELVKGDIVWINGQTKTGNGLGRIL